MSYGDSGRQNGYELTTTTALGEKAEMQRLNDKLADYMDKVKALKKSAAMGLDPRDYQESMKQLEVEVLNLKKLYEDEINRLRRKLDEANKKNENLQAEKEKTENLGQKYADAANKAHRLEGENEGLKKALAGAERDNEALQRDNKVKEQQALLNQKLGRDNEQLRSELNNEVKKRQSAEAVAKQAMDKGHFDDKVHQQQARELQERVKAQQDIINALEKRIKGLTQENDNLPSTLQKIKESNQGEMRKFKKETEDALNRNLDVIKLQQGEDRKQLAQLERENKQLEDTLRKMTARNEELEGQNAGLRNAAQSLAAENEAERARAQQTVRQAERRLGELQDALADHSKEFVNARDAQASLRNEIDTYRVLLEQEGQRLQSRGNSRASTPKTPSLPAIKSSRNGTPQGMRSSMPAMNTGFETTYRYDYTPKLRGRRY